LPLASFIPAEKIGSKIKHNSFLTLKGNELILIADGQKVKIPVENYLDFNEKGYYVFYDKMGNNLTLYEREKMLGEWKNQFKYPRISYPYLLNFSSDLSRVEVYHITQSLQKPLFTLDSEDVFTSWHSSQGGEYLILGDLSGTAHIYSFQENKIKEFKINKSKINYIKGVNVNSQGEICVLGGIGPELLYITKYGREEQTIYSVPPTGRSKRQIYNFSHYLVIEKEFGVFIVDKHNKKIKEHNLNFKLYDAKEVNYKGENFLVLLMRESLTTRVEIFSENNYQYSLWIEDQSLPIIEKRQKKVLIIWENGAVEI